jgi:hypothetical protein
MIFLLGVGHLVVPRIERSGMRDHPPGLHPGYMVSQCALFDAPAGGKFR